MKKIYFNGMLFIPPKYIFVLKYIRVEKMYDLD